MNTLRPLGYTHIPGAAPAELGRGHRLVQIIETALKRRSHLEWMGKSKVPAHELATARMKLQAWVTVNRHPWPATVRAFGFMPELTKLMVKNDEGEKMLKEARELITNA